MWEGYRDLLPGEEDNPWDEAPSDEVIEAISKDQEERKEAV